MDGRLAHWPENERVACLELALLPGSVFEAVFRFLPGGLASRALASEALFRSVMDVPRLSSDPGVAVAKLSWWQTALPRALEEGSQHPVISAALRLGVLQSMKMTEWSAFVMQVSKRIEEDPVSSADEWLQRFESIEGKRLLLEDGGADEGVRRWLQAVGSATGLLDQLSRLCLPGNAVTAVPLDLVARHQLGGSEPAARNSALAELAQAGVASIQAVPRPETSALAGQSVGAIADITGAVVEKRLAWLAAQAAETQPPAPPTASLGEVWQTWKAARRHARHFPHSDE